MKIKIIQNLSQISPRHLIEYDKRAETCEMTLDIREIFEVINNLQDCVFWRKPYAYNQAWIRTLP